MENTQTLVKLINQIFELEKKVALKTEISQFQRNFKRIAESFTEMDLVVHNPIGEAYNDTRTDCEATISGNSLENLIIKEVLKPIVYAQLSNNEKHLLQRGVVIVESK